MNLAVSNIAWSVGIEADALTLLRQRQIAGIEVAPTRWWADWQGMSPAAGKCFTENYATHGFTVPSLQAILFGRPEDKLFGSDAQRESLMGHLQRCADLAQAIGARSLVFGAPKNRELCGVSQESAFGLAREFFSAVGAYYEKRGVCLCLEPNPPQYGCQFITGSADAGRLVKTVNSPGFGLHLDTACMYLAGENIVESVRQNFEILRHFHVSEPYLGSFEAPVIDHKSVAKILNELEYTAWISLEMRELPYPIAGLATAIDFLISTYGGAN
ncbi:MAG: sugar phosphate isomerase/epimerase [Acidobacteriota bacterium]|nr:sugar phosphate isomerase/epimerase [Acidobacteriota bacterium]